MNKKMRYIHTMGYYLAIKINEGMIHATTWINLENILKAAHILYDSIYMKHPDQANPSIQKVQWLSEAGRMRRFKMIAKGYRFLSEAMKTDWQEDAQT